jgi:phosphoribosylformimino-5-aminoimidazole carboxamide ribotide isomerase
MLIIPAIDLLDNQAVRLLQGDYAKKTVYSSTPENLAMQFESDGTELLHIVDLNAAKTGKSENAIAIQNIRKSCKLKLELGGGIRSLESMAFYDDLGIDRFILGTVAVEDPKIVSTGIQKYGADRIVLGLDAKDGIVRTKGWESSSGLKVFDFLKEMVSIGVCHLIFTDISKDGMMEGPNFQIYKDILDMFPSLKVIASGGVSELEDLRKLRHITDDQLYGAITGKAVYEGKLDLKLAFTEFKN